MPDTTCGPSLIDFVADLPLSEQDCAFNVAAHRGQHRQCSDYAREKVGNYEFCERHARIVRKELGANA